MLYGAQQCDTRLQSIALNHFLQYDSFWALAADEKLDFRVLGAYGRNDARQQVNAFPVDEPRDDDDCYCDKNYILDSTSTLDFLLATYILSLASQS